MTERAGDLFLSGFEADQLDAPLDADAVSGQVLVQHRLGLGLRDEEQERIGRVLEPDIEKPHGDDTPAGVDL